MSSSSSITGFFCPSHSGDLGQLRPISVFEAGAEGHPKPCKQAGNSLCFGNPRVTEPNSRTEARWGAEVPSQVFDGELYPQSIQELDAMRASGTELGILPLSKLGQNPMSNLCLVAKACVVKADKRLSLWWPAGGRARWRFVSAKLLTPEACRCLWTFSFACLACLILTARSTVRASARAGGLCFASQQTVFGPLSLLNTATCVGKTKGRAAAAGMHSE